VIGRLGPETGAGEDEAVMRNVSKLLHIASAIGLAAAAHSNTLLQMEQRFQQNAFAAEKELKGKPVSISTFVVEVKGQDGRPVVFAGTRFFDTGLEVYVNAGIAKASEATAMKLRPGDEIRMTGVLQSRVVHSRDRLVIDGYIPSGTSVISGSIQGGTVTVSWPVYTFSETSISIVRTEADRQKAIREAQEAEQKKQREILELVTEAVQKGDAKILQRAIDHGMTPNDVEACMLEIEKLEPSHPGAATLATFYGTFLKSGKADVGRAIQRTIGDVMNTPKPHLFKVLLDLDMVNLDFRLTNGDTLLHFLIKEPVLNPSASTTRMRLFMRPENVEIVRLIVGTEKGKALANVPDRNGKTVKDYVRENQPLPSQEKAFEDLRKILLALP
jgi:hypothetical protein